MKELSLEDIQQESFKVLLKIKEICDAQNISYWLNYGTLIGAARHKGFIPWDDDIDVAMKRNDYERFVDYCINHKEELEPLVFFHYRTSRDYFLPIARLSNPKYAIIDEYGSSDYSLGLFVDIYPFDSCIPDDPSFYKKRDRFFRKIFLNYKAPIKGCNSNNIFKYLIKRLYRFLTKVFRIRMDKIISSLDYTARKYSAKHKNSNYCDCIIWSLVKNKKLKKEWFADTVDIEFNGQTFKAPIGYDEFLTEFYGNYMEMPPENERVGHHAYFAYEVEEE